MNTELLRTYRKNAFIDMLERNDISYDLRHEDDDRLMFKAGDYDVTIWVDLGGDTALCDDKRMPTACVAFWINQIVPQLKRGDILASVAP